MSIRVYPARAMALGMILLATVAAATQAKGNGHTHHKHHKASKESVLVKEKGHTHHKHHEVGKVESSHLIRKEATKRSHPASLLSVEERSESKRDLYVLVGKQMCDGGGLWKRYEMGAVKPGRYEYCAATCDEKDECIGFDAGKSGCNMYTQKAVAVGSWPSVGFNGVAAFPGQEPHDAFPQTPFDLQVGNTAFGAQGNFRCYRKTYYKPADSYFREVGNGTCSGGGLWKRYLLRDGSKVKCETACSQRDECIAFDHSKHAGQKAGMKGCFLYTSKQVHGGQSAWPYVATKDGLLEVHAGGGAHDNFPPTPYDISAGTDPEGKFDVESDAKCYAKTYWVQLESFYMQLGEAPCNGGGAWKHYQVTGKTLDECKGICDTKAQCVGIDMVGDVCRLFTRKAVQGFSTLHPGENDHDSFAQGGHNLSPGTGAGSCWVRTHAEPEPKEAENAEATTATTHTHAVPGKQAL